MPDSVDMPAPVKAMAYLLSAKSLAARLIKSSIIYPKITAIVAIFSLSAKLIKKESALKQHPIVILNPSSRVILSVAKNLTPFRVNSAKNLRDSLQESCF
jgi:hypothetical protein